MQRVERKDYKRKGLKGTRGKGRGRDGMDKAMRGNEKKPI